MEFRIVQGCWFGDRETVVDFPDNCDVSMLIPQECHVLEDHQIKDSILTPIGSERISALCKNKKTAVIIVDDISRPTPTWRLLPHVVKELNDGGIKDENISIVIAVASHRPNLREDMIKKLGENILERFWVCNHNPYAGLVNLGVTSRGTPILINRIVAEADLKIAIGAIIPHGATGFSGGAKIIVPGVAGIEAIIANHHVAPKTPRGVVENNAMRQDNEEIASLVGLDFIVNVVMNMKREIIGVFAGHYIEAHRMGARAAADAYRTKKYSNADIVIGNAYPMDTDLFQCEKATSMELMNCARPGGYVFVFMDCIEGLGYHGGVAAGINIHKGPDEAWLERVGGRKLGIISRNLTLKELRVIYPHCTMLFKSWEAAKEYLVQEKLPERKLTVAVYPCTPMQLICD